MNTEDSNSSTVEPLTEKAATAILEVRNLGKSYRRFRREWQRVLSWFVERRPLEENWVLRHIDFTIMRGEAVGIVGQNGAGKSTLLKMIVGTLQPTEGSVTQAGRVAAILELGMGFNPELTGRQNAYHSASLLGLKPEEIKIVLPEIEKFAEIGEYFEKPVRTYSSGMQVRVAFAVATAIRPDILIVDEALSVGDSYFQHKSYQRIKHFQAEGTSLLLVTHDPGMIQALCSRAILLEKGAVLRDADPIEIMDLYNALIAEKENSQVEINRLVDGTVQISSGTQEAMIDSVVLLDDERSPIEFVFVGQHVTLEIEMSIRSPVAKMVLGFLIKDRLGQKIFGTNTWHTNQVEYGLMPGEKRKYRIAFDNRLGPGSYSVSLSLHGEGTHVANNYHWVDYALVFEVINAGPYFIGSSYLQPIIQSMVVEGAPVSGGKSHEG